MFKAADRPYSQLSCSEEGDHDDPPTSNADSLQPQRSSPSSYALLVVVCVASAIISTLCLTTILIYSARDHAQPSRLCVSPTIRREWRSLTAIEKHEYITAVKCLYETPSLMGLHSRLDDFTYVHVSQDAHDVASFLPWHRMFLHLYEQSLAQHCGFKHQLPYWDWSLDWQNLTGSSIWSNTHGFGGENGASPDSGCVTGPFADLRVSYDNETIRPQPHCITRHFTNIETGEPGSMSGKLIGPDAIGHLGRSPDYGEFRYEIEGTFHNAIHLQIEGDLNTMAAPNDPLFWLHHVQLDRLWWKWQQDEPSSRLHDYGQSEEQPSAAANLEDVLAYSGFASDYTVGDAMFFLS
ncbi:hypothetical protein F5Y15DRAFT_419386 [Xylariaceae sp. FL0016]|nr:hypothetical protein F5Y15DRAFT_419386 [Xylariaceae sp. FL0016]